MKKRSSTILAAAVTGLLMGGTSGCTSEKPAEQPKNEKPAAEIEKHACKGLNSCKGNGGCGVEGKHTCKGNNDCSGKGGCPTVPKHTCGGLNDCKGQGGCKVEGKHDCAGKNECAKKGGCHVPVKKAG